MKQIQTIADIETYIQRELKKMILPFDYLRLDVEHELFVEYLRFLKEEGFLTESMKPTQFSIDMDFIRINNGSIHFSELSQQPDLLITGFGAMTTLQLFQQKQFSNNLNPAKHV